MHLPNALQPHDSLLPPPSCFSPFYRRSEVHTRR
nr:MAG TPA: Cleavage and polyadenylation specificity factor [Caudoviricetes sp.]